MRTHLATAILAVLVRLFGCCGGLQEFGKQLQEADRLAWLTNTGLATDAVREVAVGEPRAQAPAALT